MQVHYHTTPNAPYHTFLFPHIIRKLSELSFVCHTVYCMTKGYTPLLNIFFYATYPFINLNSFAFLLPPLCKGGIKGGLFLSPFYLHEFVSLQSLRPVLPSTSRLASFLEQKGGGPHGDRQEPIPPSLLTQTHLPLHKGGKAVKG